MRPGHPLENNVILNSIFKNLNNSQRLKARLICQSWNDETMRGIKKSNRSALEWIKLASERSRSNRKDYFKKLNTLLNKSINPELLMEFINIDKVNEVLKPEAQLCFLNYGIYIKCLSIKYKNNLNEKTMQTILYNFCPNLITLQITGWDYFDHTDPRSNLNSIGSSNITLEEWTRPLRSLQVLNLNDSTNTERTRIGRDKYKLLSEILNVAVNLNYLELKLIMLQHLLPYLIYNHYNTTSENMQRSILILQRLRTLSVTGVDWGHMLKKGKGPDTMYEHEVNRFLDLISNSIESLRFVCIVSDHARWNFPRMENLKTFSVGVLRIPDKMIRIGRLFKAMPYLESLKIEQMCVEVDLSDSRGCKGVDFFFESGDLNKEENKDQICFRNLKVFKLEAYPVTELAVKKMCGVFPNLKSLSLRIALPNWDGSGNDGETFLGNISKMIATSLKGLELLEINIFLSREAEEGMKEEEFVVRFCEDVRGFCFAPGLKTLQMKTEEIFPKDLVDKLREEFPSIEIVLEIAKKFLFNMDELFL